MRRRNMHVTKRRDLYCRIVKKRSKDGLNLHFSAIETFQKVVESQFQDVKLVCAHDLETVPYLCHAHLIYISSERRRRGDQFYQIYKENSCLVLSSTAEMTAYAHVCSRSPRGSRSLPFSPFCLAICPENDTKLPCLRKSHAKMAFFYDF